MMDRVMDGMMGWGRLMLLLGVVLIVVKATKARMTCRIKMVSLFTSSCTLLSLMNAAM